MSQILNLSNIDIPENSLVSAFDIIGMCILPLALKGHLRQERESLLLQILVHILQHQQL